MPGAIACIEPGLGVPRSQGRVCPAWVLQPLNESQSCRSPPIAPVPFPRLCCCAPLPGRIGTLAAGKNPPLGAIADFGVHAR
ncbi:MAG: hypothetical protein OXU61_10100 [Gammaproteobacteria bacterium]|nr:hypothetical protein [Gammaproteobacteria bacterium]